METTKEFEDMGDAMVESLKKVNAAYERINFKLMALEIRMKEDADKNKRIGDALKPKRDDGEVCTVQPQRHYDDSPLVSWSCPNCGGKIIATFKAVNGRVVDDHFTCEDCNTRVAL